MNRKQWLKEENKNWYWRNLAVKYFNLQKGEVIHHLRETEEQQEFNDQYYERWGFDLNGKMKYAIKMTIEDHIKFHHSDKIRNKKISNSMKGKPSNTTGKPWSEKRRKLYEERKKNGYTVWNKGIKCPQISESKKGKKFSEEHRKKLSEAHKGLKMSEITRQAILKSITGRKKSEEEKRKIWETRRKNEHKIL